MLDSLGIAHAVFSTLFRLAAFLFLRYIPSPWPTSSSPSSTLVEETKHAPVENGTAPIENGTDDKAADIKVSPVQNGAVVQDSQEEDAFRTIALSLPARSPRLRYANAAINALMALAAVEFIATPFFDTAADLSFSRIGAVTSDSVKIAVRFPTPNATVQLLWREQKEQPAPWRNGPSLSFSPDADYVHTVKLSGLWPNTSISSPDALADENRTVSSGPFQFRTFPDSRLSTGSHFRFVASSCLTPNYPYLPLHGRTIKGFDLLSDYLFPATAPIETPPPAEFMLFLGDFIYSDVPAYIGDSTEAYRRLYRRNYQSKSFKKIYERLPIFHTYDDHEVACSLRAHPSYKLFFVKIKNDYIGLGNDSQPPFPSASDAFKIYNADANHDSLADQYYYNFRYGDAAFFVLDTRRYPRRLHSWLAHANDTASFKFIVSSVPFTSLWGYGQSDGWAGYPLEKRALLDALHSVPNVIIISGDRHEFASIEFNSPHLHTVHEYSTSPLSMFDVPFIRTLRMQSEETVPRTRNDMVLTDEGPIQINETVQVPKERVVKYMARGNIKWSAFEVDTTDLTRPYYA
ncbi:PhoD-like phosphatase-domain-containing protein [Mycena haematopus]|nr:PhoD-like phosphatase-domain-containing protein [Mycena haematopus]